MKYTVVTVGPFSMIVKISPMDRLQHYPEHLLPHPAAGQRGTLHPPPRTLALHCGRVVLKLQISLQIPVDLSSSSRCSDKPLLCLKHQQPNTDQLHHSRCRARQVAGEL